MRATSGNRRVPQVILSFTGDNALRERLRTVAQRENRTVSDLLRALALEGLDRRDRLDGAPARQPEAASASASSAA